MKSAPPSLGLKIHLFSIYPKSSREDTVESFSALKTNLAGMT